MKKIKKSLRFILLVAFCAFAQGCVARTTAVNSAEGKAYVFKGSAFGTDMLFCNAVNGKPKCRPVTEVKN